MINDLQNHSDEISISENRSDNGSQWREKITYDIKNPSKADGVKFDKSHITLGHELAHAWLYKIGHSSLINEKIGKVRYTEAFAVRFENYLRAHAGESKMRMTYDGNSITSFTQSTSEYFKNMNMPLRSNEFYHPGQPRQDVPGNQVTVRDATFVSHRPTLYTYDTRTGKFTIVNQSQ